MLSNFWPCETMWIFFISCEPEAAQNCPTNFSLSLEFGHLSHVGRNPRQWAVACSPGQVRAVPGYRSAGDYEPTQWATEW